MCICMYVYVHVYMLPDKNMTVKKEVGMYETLVLVSAVMEDAEGEREQVGLCVRVYAYTHTHTRTY